MSKGVTPVISFFSFYLTFLSSMDKGSHICSFFLFPFIRLFFLVWIKEVTCSFFTSPFIWLFFLARIKGVILFIFFYHSFFFYNVTEEMTKLFFLSILFSSTSKESTFYPMRIYCPLMKQLFVPAYFSFVFCFINEESKGWITASWEQSCVSWSVFCNFHYYFVLLLAIIWMLCMLVFLIDNLHHTIHINTYFFIYYCLCA